MSEKEAICDLPHCDNDAASRVCLSASSMLIYATCAECARRLLAHIDTARETSLEAPAPVEVHVAGGGCWWEVRDAAGNAQIAYAPDPDVQLASVRGDRNE